MERVKFVKLVKKGIEMNNAEEADKAVARLVNHSFIELIQSAPETPQDETEKIIEIFNEQYGKKKEDQEEIPDIDSENASRDTDEIMHYIRKAQALIRKAKMISQKLADNERIKDV